MVGMKDQIAELLTVLIDGKPVGTVTVSEHTPIKVFGKFNPTASLELYRPIFKAAVELARQFDATSTNEPCNYALWNQLMEAYGEINRLNPAFAELTAQIEEFAVHEDWSVEVTLVPATR